VGKVNIHKALANQQLVQTDHCIPYIYNSLHITVTRIVA